MHVRRGDEVVIGPFQAMLLEAIRDTGSISAAQRRLGASYAYTWKMVARLNGMFGSPLVEPVRGGSKGGGANLTRAGQRVLAAFRRLEVLAQTHGNVELLEIRNVARHAKPDEV